MGRVPDHVLADIRDRVKVSTVVGRKFKLRKQGAEYVAVEDQSLTVNDAKQVWWDFGKGDDGGDIFDFEMQHNGRNFNEAVEVLAAEAGIDIDHARGASSGSGRSGNASREGSVRGEDQRREEASSSRSRPAAGSRKEVVATFDYVDPQGLRYQVVRSQRRLSDGSWELSKSGKPWKTFQQRRPSPDDDGSWIWRLDVHDRETGQPFEFMKVRDGWVGFDEERFVGWRLSERRKWPGVQNVKHWLYRAAEIAEELRQPRDDQRTIYLAEGEGKVAVLEEWGLPATTNSGGAKNFTVEIAEFFRGAADVVVLVDNDKAGRERLAKVGAMLRDVGAGVRALNFRDHWDGCPDKGDVKDFHDAGFGRDDLLEIVDRLPAWKPEPYKSRFGAKTSADLSAPAKPYPWRIKGIAPLNDTFLVMGPSQSGKTFEMLDMVMHVCTSKPEFAGRKVVPCGVIYLAYEGTSGFENRIRAYMQHHNLTDSDLHSFAWLTRPPNLFNDDANVLAMAEEMLEIAKGFQLPLGVVVIDTHNASTRGASEVKSDEIGRIINHHRLLAERTGATPWLIGHTNSEGKHRGNEQLYNTIETTMLIERLHEKAGDPKSKELRDDEGRVIRRVRMKKQRDGSDEVHWDFVLHKVVIGKDEDGEDIPSMVSVEPAQKVPEQEIRAAGKPQKPQGVYLNIGEVAMFKALLRAVEEVGVVPPVDLQVSASVARVIRTTDFGAEFRKGEPRAEGEDHVKYMNRTKSALKRFKDKMANWNVVAVREAGDVDGTKSHYIWPTGRKVWSRGFEWPRQPKPKEEPALVDEATGRPITGDDFLGTAF